MTETLKVSQKTTEAIKTLLADEEIQSLQEYANTVSIKRLGFNDHGPVHMRTVTYNAVLMLDILNKANIIPSLVKDGCGEFEDSLLAIVLAGMLHDIGMCLGRHNHENHSMAMAQRIIDNFLEKLYGSDWHKRAMIRSVALEGIAGHMGTLIITSLEAGIIQVADGCDMTKGRARIPMSMINNHPRIGNIHQYSADSIEELSIQAGNEKPIRIDIHMSNESGLFQIEENLLHKIANSTATQYLELYAKVRDHSPMRYL
jgi:metal-dependent HD superfamily phosphatase/phosphodiesterase